MQMQTSHMDATSVDDRKIAPPTLEPHHCRTLRQSRSAKKETSTSSLVVPYQRIFPHEPPFLHPSLARDQSRAALAPPRFDAISCHHRIAQKRLRGLNLSPSAVAGPRRLGCGAVSLLPTHNRLHLLLPPSLRQTRDRRLSGGDETAPLPAQGDLPPPCGVTAIGAGRPHQGGERRTRRQSLWHSFVCTHTLHIHIIHPSPSSPRPRGRRLFRHVVGRPIQHALRHARARRRASVVLLARPAAEFLAAGHDRRRRDADWGLRQLHHRPAAATTGHPMVSKEKTPVHPILQRQRNPLHTC